MFWRSYVLSRHLKSQTIHSPVSGEAGIQVFHIQIITVNLLTLTNTKPFQIQWGSEIGALKIRTFWKSDYKWSRFKWYGYNLVPAIQNPDVFSQAQMVLTKWRPFVCISNCWASRPFAFQPLFDHLKSRLVRIIVRHYICLFLAFIK